MQAACAMRPRDRNRLIWAAATSVTAAARPVDGTAGARLRCAAVGELRIVQSVFPNGERWLDLWHGAHRKVASFRTAHDAEAIEIVSLKAATIPSWLPALVAAAAASPSASLLAMPAAGTA